MLKLREKDIVRITNRRRAAQWEDAVGTVQGSPHPVRVLDETYDCIIEELKKVVHKSVDTWRIKLIPHRHDKFVSNTIHIPISGVVSDDFGIQNIEVVGRVRR